MAQYRYFYWPLIFDVGFAHALPPTHGAFTPTKHLIQQWHQTDNPAVNSQMVKWSNGQR
jgi:hypothetical protein